MRIESDIKLDFKDVLLRPKRSTLGSRANVDLDRQYSFRHARLEMPVVPVIAANMDTVGTFEMARALSAHKILTAIHKHYPVEDLVAFFGPDDAGASRHAFYSLGILGGLRSACTYVGARKLKDLSKCTTFVRVTQQINEIFGASS